MIPFFFHYPKNLFLKHNNNNNKKGRNFRKKYHKIIRVERNFLNGSQMCPSLKYRGRLRNENAKRERQGHAHCGVFEIMPIASHNCF